MSSKSARSKPSSGKLTVNKPRFQRGKSLVPLTAKSEVEENANPIPTKKPLTEQDKELLDACESGDIDKVCILC